MRYLCMVGGILGIVRGLGYICGGLYPSHNVEQAGYIVGSGFLVAGTVLLAVGLATWDIVAAIKRGRPPQKPGDESVE
jgi:hypothetical protein